MSRSARPNKSATRLTGVTRSRSMTPMRSSEIKLNPTPAAPNMPSCTSSPGTKTLYAPPGGKSAHRRDRFEERREQDQVEQRLENAECDPDGVVDEDPEVASEDEPCIAQDLHAAVSRSERPV